MDVSCAIEVRGNLEVGLVMAIGAAQWNMQADLGGGAFDLSHRGDLINSGLGAAPAFSGSPFGVFQTTVRLYLDGEAAWTPRSAGCAEQAARGVAGDRARPRSPCRIVGTADGLRGVGPAAPRHPNRRT